MRNRIIIAKLQSHPHEQDSAHASDRRMENDFRSMSRKWILQPTFQEGGIKS